MIDWVAVTAVASVLIPAIGYVMLNERRMGRFLTRREHEELCEKRNREYGKHASEMHQANIETLARIEGKIDRAEERRHQMADSLQTIVGRLGYLEGRDKRR